MCSGFPDLDDIPEVKIEGPSEAEVGESIQFYSEASLGTAPYIYSWDFDEDGETDSTKQNPKFTFSEPGEYEIVLEILDSVGSPGGNITYITIKGSSQPGSDDSGAITFMILIAFVVIVGIAAVVFIIRR